MRLFFLAIPVFHLFLANPLVYAEALVLNPLRRIESPTGKLDEIGKYAPFTDAQFETPTILWLTGRGGVLRFDIKGDQVQRVQLTAVNEAVKFERLGSDGASIFVSADDRMVQVRLNPFRMMQYTYPSYVSGKSLCFLGLGDHYYWMHESGIFQFDRYANQISKKSNLGRELGAARNKVALTEKPPTMWVIQDARLLKYPLDKLLEKGKVVYHAKESLDKIRATGKRLFVSSNSKVFVIDATSGLQKVIDVHHKQPVVDFQVTENHHVYLFKDGVVEVRDIKRHQTHYYRIKADADFYPGDFEVMDKSLAVISNGQIAIYDLEQSQPVVSYNLK